MLWRLQPLWRLHSRRLMEPSLPVLLRSRNLRRVRWSSSPVNAQSSTGEVSMWDATTLLTFSNPAVTPRHSTGCSRTGRASSKARSQHQEQSSFRTQPASLSAERLVSMPVAFWRRARSWIPTILWRAATSGSEEVNNPGHAWKTQGVLPSMPMGLQLL